MILAIIVILVILALLFAARWMDNQTQITEAIETEVAKQNAKVPAAPAAIVPAPKKIAKKAPVKAKAAKKTSAKRK